MIRSKLILVAVAMFVSTGCAKKVSAYHLNEPQDPTGDELRKKDDAALAAMLKDCVLHFGYDDSTLTEADQSNLQKVAAALRVRPWIAIRIAGHADERGTEEYNLALGQRRADAARAYLIHLGATNDQVETVTFGEEVPLMNDGSEAAFAMNRRDELGIMPLELLGYLGKDPAEELR